MGLYLAFVIVFVFAFTFASDLALSSSYPSCSALHQIRSGLALVRPTPLGLLFALSGLLDTQYARPALVWPAGLSLQSP